MNKFKLNNYFNNYSAKIFIFFIFIILILILRYTCLEDYISFEKIKLYENYLKNFVLQHHFKAVLIYLLVFIVGIISFIPIIVIMSLLGGFLFGLFWGVLYINICIVLGSTVLFLIFRHLLGDFIRKKASKSFASKLQYFDEHINKYGSSYLLSLQLFPATPVFLINIFSGLTKISLWKFVWTTSVGILPGSVIYVFMGQQIAKMEMAKEIFSWPIILIFVLLGLLSFMPILFCRFSKHRAAI